MRGLDLPLSALAPLVAPAGRVFVFGRARAGAAGWREEPGPPGVQTFARDLVSRET